MTPREQAILDYIGNFPTVKEIAESFRFNQIGHTYKVINDLEKQGEIKSFFTPDGWRIARWR